MNQLQTSPQVQWVENTPLKKRLFFADAELSQVATAVESVMGRGVRVYGMTPSYIETEYTTETLVEWRGDVTRSTRLRILASKRAGGIDVVVENYREVFIYQLILVAVTGIPMTAGLSVLLAIAAYFAHREIVGRVNDKCGAALVEYMSKGAPNAG